MAKPIKIVDIGEGKAEIHEFSDDDVISDEFIDINIARLAQVVTNEQFNELSSQTVKLTGNQDIDGIKTFNNTTVYNGNSYFKTSSGVSKTAGIYIDNILRWLHVLSHGTSGNKYAIQRYNASGAFLDEPLSLLLTTGEIQHKGINLIQSGANANGNWVRFYDGTQICYSGVVSLATNPSVTVYWTYPIAFAHGGINTQIIGWGVPVTPFISDGGSTTQIGFRAYDHTGAFPPQENVRLLSIGRWY